MFARCNGEDTAASGEAVDVAMGCLMDMGVARPVPAHGELDGLSFVAPGWIEDGDQQAIWQAFDQLP